MKHVLIATLNKSISNLLKTFFWNEKTKMLSWILSSKVSLFTYPVHKNPTGKELEQIRTHGYLMGYPALFLWLRIKFVAKDQYQARTNLVLKKYA